MDHADEEPTYIEIVCETKFNTTENKELLSKILQSFLDGEIILDTRFDGDYMLIRNSGWSGLEKLKIWIRHSKLLDTIRRRLLRSSIGNITAIYFNKQAAAMNKLSLVDGDDTIPLGYISFQIVSDNLEYVINKLAPKTFEGKELNAEEWKFIYDKKQKIKKK